MEEENSIVYHETQVKSYFVLLDQYIEDVLADSPITLRTVCHILAIFKLQREHNPKYSATTFFNDIRQKFPQTKSWSDRYFRYLLDAGSLWNLFDRHKKELKGTNIRTERQA